MNKWN